MEEEAGRVVGRTYRMEGGNRVDGTCGGVGGDVKEEKYRQWKKWWKVNGIRHGS